MGINRDRTKMHASAASSQKLLPGERAQIAMRDIDERPVACGRHFLYTR